MYLTLVADGCTKVLNAPGHWELVQQLEVTQVIVDKNWAVSITRVREFFDSQPDVQAIDDGYRYKDCQITLTEVPLEQQGPVRLPRTQLHINGPDAEAEHIYHRFFLQFLSAGG